MAAPITTIGVADYSAQTDFEVKAGAKVIVNIGGTGTATLQYDDGNGTFVDYPDTGTGFGCWLPPSGTIRLDVTAGTVQFGMSRADA